MSFEDVSEIVMHQFSNDQRRLPGINAGKEACNHLLQSRHDTAAPTPAVSAGAILLIDEARHRLVGFELRPRPDAQVPVQNPR